MSTRAIVRVVDNSGEEWSIYVHSDGGEFLNKYLKAFAKAAPRIDPNSPFYKGTPSNPSSKWCRIVYSPNVSLEASRFITGFIGYFTRVGHSSLYMTKRDPIKEAIKGWTDIEYYYIVFLDGKGSIKIDVLSYEDIRSLAGSKKKSKSLTLC